jgi:hypothetical protein
MDDYVYKKGIVNCFLFNSLLFLTVLSMLRTIRQEPGYICKEYEKYFSLDNLDDSPVLMRSNFEALFINDYDITDKDFIFKFLYYTRDLSKLPNLKHKMHCVFCRTVRPERTHHCRKCKRCVLKMDHHCNILNTCIGYYNYKLYITFLFYTILTIAYTVLTMLDGVRFYFVIYGWENRSTQVFTLSFLLLAFAFISIFELFISHMIYISRGATTIEYEGYNGNVSNNKSFYTNLREIFKADNPLCWLWPSCNDIY